MDKWLAIQATSRLPGTLETVKALMTHPVFTIKNPNKVRALIGAFASNAVRFHDLSGAGYAFVADQVLAIDPMNPQIAARLVSAFTMWKRYDEKRQALMKKELEAHPGSAQTVEGRVRSGVEEPGVGPRKKQGNGGKGRVSAAILNL